MANETVANDESDTIEVDLRNPFIAGVLAWLIPGAGHVYQRRYAKGILFMLCILGTYFFGLGLADGHVVYASLTKDDFRWQYACQLGVGVPAMPALVQNYLDRRGEKTLFGGFMAPPSKINVQQEGDVEEFDAQPDELSQWHLRYHGYFEMATLYTMIAGLLNVLAIYDAAAGPVLFGPYDEKPVPKPPNDPKKGGT